MTLRVIYVYLPFESAHKQNSPLPISDRDVHIHVRMRAGLCFITKTIDIIEMLVFDKSSLLNPFNLFGKAQLHMFSTNLQFLQILFHLLPPMGSQTQVPAHIFIIMIDLYTYISAQNILHVCIV